MQLYPPTHPDSRMARIITAACSIPSAPPYLLLRYSYEYTDHPTHCVIRVSPNYAYKHIEILARSVVRRESQGDRSVSMNNRREGSLILSPAGSS